MIQSLCSGGGTHSANVAFENTWSSSSPTVDNHRRIALCLHYSTLPPPWREEPAITVIGNSSEGVCCLLSRAVSHGVHLAIVPTPYRRVISSNAVETLIKLVTSELCTLPQDLSTRTISGTWYLQYRTKHGFLQKRCSHATAVPGSHQELSHNGRRRRSVRYEQQHSSNPTRRRLTNISIIS